MGYSPVTMATAGSPAGQLVGHHDLVVCVGHKEPDGVLEDILDELVVCGVSCLLLVGVVVLGGVHTAKVLARITATC